MCSSIHYKYLTQPLLKGTFLVYSKHLCTQLGGGPFSFQHHCRNREGFQNHIHRIRHIFGCNHKKNIHSVQTIISSLALKKKLNPTQCSWTISIAFQQNCYGPVRRGSTALSYLSVSIMRLDNRIWSTVHHPILLPVLWCRY